MSRTRRRLTADIEVVADLRPDPAGARFVSSQHSALAAVLGQPLIDPTAPSLDKPDKTYCP
jgi:hypothetical protein